jgi:D-alanyl-D-alanine carboxypeptidase
MDATGRAVEDRDLDARLDTVVSTIVEQARIPGAVVGVWSRDHEYVRAFGVADRETAAPMTTDLHFRIGSLTKTFTLTAVLQLVDDGDLSLDDAIARYVPGVPRGEEITLRQLGRMQSGLPNYSVLRAFQKELGRDPHRGFTPAELLDFAFGEPSAFAPGEGFQYSNTNTVLLGLAVETVTGRSLSTVISDRVTGPLRLSDTVFPTGAEFPEPHAQGYTTQTRDRDEAVATHWNPSWAWAAGAMISTPADLRVWVEALATGRLVRPETHRDRLRTVSVPGLALCNRYGLGLFDLDGWVGHNGSLPGYQSVGVHLPARGISLVVLINTDTAHDGAEPGTLLATAITEVITPDHRYTLD